MHDRAAPARSSPIPAAAETASLSPSLGSSGAGVAREMKFLVGEDGARQIEQRLLRTLLPDPHSDPALGGMYAIANLACDSPDLGVFFRGERMEHLKYRVRRYGAADEVYLERKYSRKGVVGKRRTPAPLGGFGAVATGQAGDAAHAWFAGELRSRDLAPVCRLRYLRRALFGDGPDGPMRVTFDRSLRGSLCSGWSLEHGPEERPLAPGLVVCEFKFVSTIPSPLKAIIAAMALEPTGFSKYRACIRAFAPELGLDPAVATTHAAPDPAAQGDPIA